MSMSVKIAAIIALVGLMVTAIVGMTLRKLPSPKEAVAQGRPMPAIATDRLARCRTLTAPDVQCVAAWEAARRRFFRDETQ